MEEEYIDMLLSHASRLTTKQIPVEYVKQVIRDKTVKKFLCPVLRTLTGDALDISKIITPILVPLNLAGTITIPMEP